MLTERSIPAPQVIKDPPVKVRVLSAFYMAGKVCEVGSTVSMPRTDAIMAATNVTPPQVEIL